MRHWVVVAVLAALAGCSLTAPPPSRPPPKSTPAPESRSKTEKPEEEAHRPPPPEEQPPPPPPRAPTIREYRLSPATKALVTQAQSLAASGDFPVAQSTVERALRIEPGNPLLWIELGKIHQAAANYPQAESTARKALSLATGDIKVQAAAWQLVAQSLRARGRVQEAQQAQARADSLTPD